MLSRGTRGRGSARVLGARRKATTGDRAPGGDRAFRYRAQHAAFAAVSGVLMRAFHAAMNPALPRAPRAELEAVQRRYQELLDEDLRAAREGVVPRELVLEMPLGAVARETPSIIVEIPRVLLRKHRGAVDDLPSGVDRERFPPYYLRNFHWQSDGWLSRRSARLYDPAVELLFGGTADVMRRSALPPVLDAVRLLSRPEILDVACGTGRFLAQLARARPEAHLTGIDLSRPYVEHARRLLAERGADADVVVGNVESLPWRDGLFDAVVCIFLFHELPRDARRTAAAEMFRVLRPGGTLVVVDSAQRHDAPDIAAVLESFPRIYHEPYFRSFLSDPLDALLVEQGFVIDDRHPAFVATRTVARRPLSS